jgi:hypothetical protein
LVSKEVNGGLQLQINTASAARKQDGKGQDKRLKIIPPAVP